MDSIQRHKRLLFEIHNTYKAKNHDYEGSFERSFKKFGLIAPVVRMSDKMSRLEALCTKQAQVKDESIRDTLLDLANYAIMTVMELDAQKE